MELNHLLIREATVHDIPFIVEAIIQAEMSGTTKPSIATLFGLDEVQVKLSLSEILNEKTDGCEFSLSSFLVAEINGNVAGAVAGWIENFKDFQSSKFLKANLIQLFFPKESIYQLRKNKGVLKNIMIERHPGYLQLEYVFVKNEFRGKGVAQKLIIAHIQKALRVMPTLIKAQIQLYGNNILAKKLYERLMFTVVAKFRGDDERILDFLPSNEKLLMEKTLSNE